MELRTNDLAIFLSDTPKHAPTYRKPEFYPANLKSARIVGQGTVEGYSTIDLIFEDEQGRQYVAMITARLISNVAAASLGMLQRTKPEATSL